MPNYGFGFSNTLINTGFLVVGLELSRGSRDAFAQGGTGAYVDPSLNSYWSDFLTTAADGTKGYIRLYPTLNHQTTAPSPIVDADTLYIGWDVNAQGVGTYTLTAPPVYKLSRVTSGQDGPFSFAVSGAYGAGTCQPGYVWRDAFPGDHVCVLPEIRAQAAIDNSQASSRVDPDAASGSGSCKMGYVWRQARPEDHVCVTPATREQTAADNAKAASRLL